MAYSIQQTFDRGYIVAGMTGFLTGQDDFWVLKLDSNGEIEWQKAYDGGDGDWAGSIQQTSDGGYIVAGMTESFGAGLTDIWVLKLDYNGDVAWQKTYGGGGDDWAFSIQQTSDGGYIMAGQTESFGAGQGDFWVLKLDSNGDVAWQKTYGGSDWDEANSIQQTSDGGYIMAGYTESFGAGQSDIWVLKLDSSGNIPECPLIADSTATVTDTTVTGSDTAVSGVNTAVTSVDTSVTSSNTDCSIATQCYYSPVGYTVTFDTIPANTGEITFDGTGYSDGDTVSKDIGVYTITANPAVGYTFTGWETEGNIIVVVPGLATTTCTISGGGVLRMVQVQIGTIAWNCPLGLVALISPYPANDRPLLTTAVDLSQVTCDDTWFQVYYLDEDTGDVTFYDSFMGFGTMNWLQPWEFYYVVVFAPCNVYIPQ